MNPPITSSFLLVMACSCFTGRFLCRLIVSATDPLMLVFMISLSGPRFAGENGRKSRTAPTTESMALVTLPIAPRIPLAIELTILEPACLNRPNILVTALYARCIPFDTADRTRLNALRTIPARLLKILWMVDLMLFTILEIVDRMLFHTLEAVERILLNMLTIVDRMELNRLLTAETMLEITLDIVDLMLFHTLEAIDRILLNILDTVDLILLNRLLTADRIF